MKRILFFSGLIVSIFLIAFSVLFLFELAAVIQGNENGEMLLLKFFQQPLWLLIPEMMLMAYSITRLSLKETRHQAKEEISQLLEGIFS